MEYNYENSIRLRLKAYQILEDEDEVVKSHEANYSNKVRIKKFRTVYLSI